MAAADVLVRVGVSDEATRVCWSSVTGVGTREERVQAPAGAPDGSPGVGVRRAGTGAKQAFNGAFNPTLFYK